MLATRIGREAIIAALIRQASRPGGSRVYPWQCYTLCVESNGNPATRADLETLENRLRTDMESLENRLLERIEKTETTLLREFRRWAISFESRFRANEILVGGFNERMIALEERVSGLEQRD